ncbi:hypothetical protein KBB85_04400 [Patescibacteria group bacterium]|nr:hypothetical protein [Patescibacteria group bacterium]
MKRRGKGGVIMSGTQDEFHRIAERLSKEAVPLCQRGRGMMSTDRLTDEESPVRIELVRMSSSSFSLKLFWGPEARPYGYLVLRCDEPTTEGSGLTWIVWARDGLWATSEDREWFVLERLATALSLRQSFPCGREHPVTPDRLEQVLVIIAKAYLAQSGQGLAP